MANRVFYREYSDLRPASARLRLCAMIYDGFLLVAVWMAVAGIAVAIHHGEAIDSPMGRASLQSALFCASYLFFGYFWTRNGQTLGMQAWNLRVQTNTGERLTWMQALIRFLGAIVSLLPLGLGYLYYFFSDERLTWHDRWSSSIVVQLPSKR